MNPTKAPIAVQGNVCNNIRVLLCGHTYCTRCIKNMLAEDLQCPMCRHVTFFPYESSPESAAEALVVNKELLAALEIPLTEEHKAPTAKEYEEMYEANVER